MELRFLPAMMYGNRMENDFCSKQNKVYDLNRNDLTVTIGLSTHQHIELKFITVKTQNPLIVYYHLTTCFGQNKV